MTLLLLYFVTASGFALNLHYCGNLISSVKLDAPAEKCGTVQMKCCKDVHVDVKVKDAHQTQAESFLAKLIGFDIPKIHYYAYPVPVRELALDTTPYRGPPDGCGNQPVYLKNCVFRI